MIDLKNIAYALGGEINRDQVLAPGPNHSRQDRSLSIKLAPESIDGFVCHSFAGDDGIECKDYVRKKLGLPAFKPNGSRAAPKPGAVVATYDYVDAAGTLLYQVVRLEPKSFLQRRPDGNGGWIWKQGERRVLYRLPEILKYPDGTVFVTEGEKDANRVAALGHCATTVAHGKWTDECVNALAGRDVLIFEDNDDTGREKALKAAQLLHGKAKTVRVVRLPGLSEGGDVSDWLDAGHSGDGDDLVEKAFDTPLWNPADSQPRLDPPVQLSAPIALPFIDFSKWDEQPTPDRDWAVRDRIPLRQTALFTGEGGSGKSAVTLHLCAAHVLGRDWLRSLPEIGPAIFLDAEDDEREIHIRLSCIARHYDVSYRELMDEGLHLMSFVGQDAVLATVSRNGKIEPTKLYGQILEAAADIKPKMIGIASSANVFSGAENDRSQVQQFVALLTRLAISANGSVQLISHPSLTGINSDSGLSGSTQWHNAVRARSYLKGIKPESGEQPDDDLRELIFKKNQYGSLADRVVLRYRDGMFLQVPGMASLDRLAQQSKAQEVFITLLRRFTSENRNLSANPGRGYAPSEFAGEDEARKANLRKADFKDAMRQLFKDGKIWNEPYVNSSRHRGYRLAEKS